jgi:hypothetical protein
VRPYVPINARRLFGEAELFPGQVINEREVVTTVPRTGDPKGILFALHGCLQLTTEWGFRTDTCNNCSGPDLNHWLVTGLSLSRKSIHTLLLPIASTEHGPSIISWLACTSLVLELVNAQSYLRRPWNHLHQ